MKNSISDMTAIGIELSNGTTSAVKLLEHYFKAIQLYQPELNCYVMIDEASAKRDAVASDIRRRENTLLSPVDGIPVALKDNFNVAGAPTKNGTRMQFPFDAEADVVRKLRAAGAVILGKLNMDECAFGATTDNPHHNRTHNPWQAGYIPGGSSGGAGSAVSGGLAMMAMGSDTLGSVRLPAAYCGVVGLKPTQGLISIKGVIPLSPSLDDVGPICLSVRDAAILLNILVENEPENWTCNPDCLSSLKNLRIGVLEQISDVDLTEDVAAGFEQVKSELHDQGAEIVPVSIPALDMGKLRRAALLIIEVEGAEALAEPLRDNPDCFSDGLKAMFSYGLNASAAKIERARQYLEEVKTATLDVFDNVDLLVSPTAPQAAFPFEGPTPGNQADLTALANVCGWPAISLPTGLNASGLPLAAQFTAAAYHEARLLSTAIFMEEIWGHYSPDLPKRN